MATPIWTAFITKPMMKKSWIKVITTKTLQLDELHPYIFCPNYSPPISKNGKFRLQFTTAKGTYSLRWVGVDLDLTVVDAQNFIEMVNTLAS